MLALEHRYSFLCMGLGESGLSLEDMFILTRMSLCGASILDLANLSREDRENVEGLKRLYRLAQNGPIFTAQGTCKAATANAKKTSFGSWIRYFFKDLQPVKTMVSGVERDFVTGPHYGQRLYMVGFFAFFLSYYVMPGYPVDSPSPAVFPLAVLLARGQLVALAPFFLGSLYRQLDLVHTNLGRSLGRCDHLSMVHTNFLLAYFFEHFHVVAPVPRTFQSSAQWSRAEQWYGTSNNVSWYEACDIEANFTPRPYCSTSPGVIGVGQCLLPTSSSLCLNFGSF